VWLPSSQAAGKPGPFALPFSEREPRLPFFFCPANIMLHTMNLPQRMKADLNNEAQMTRRLLARIPAAKLGFTPGHGLHTIGWNASHLVSVLGWVPGILNAPGLDVAEVDAELIAATRESETDLTAMLITFDENLARSLEALEVASDAQLDEPWTMSMGGQVLFTMKKGECLSKWVFGHTAHHRGVLSATLRLAGVEHASIYEE